MRISAVEHALKNFKKANINLDKIRCMDVGGTKKVYLQTNNIQQQGWRRRIKNAALRLIGDNVEPAKTIIITDNPLIAVIPDLQFFDRGFNANLLNTESDIEGDFLNYKNVAPLENTFDLVVSFDTLEHVSDPFTFCDNLVRIAKASGYIYLQTVFSWEYHPSPKDYFRFSPDGLRECFSRSGGEIIDCDWDIKEVSVFAFLRKP